MIKQRLDTERGWYMVPNNWLIMIVNTISMISVFVADSFLAAKDQHINISEATRNRENNTGTKFAH